MHCGKLSPISLLIAFTAAFAGSAYALTFNIVTQQAPAAVFQLVGTSPYDNEKVKTVTAYDMRFSMPIKPDRSFIKIISGYGHPVNSGDLTSDGMSLHTEFEALPPGRYSVRWQAECQCNSALVLSDTFHFTVRH